MVAFWGSLSLFAVDNRVSKEEQRWLVDQFGNDRAEGALRFLRGHGQSASEAIEDKLTELSCAAGRLNAGEAAELHKMLSAAWQVSGGDQEARDAAIGSLVSRFLCES